MPPPETGKQIKYGISQLRHGPYKLKQWSTVEKRGTIKYNPRKITGADKKQIQKRLQI